VKSQRVYAILGFLVWQVLKRQASRRAKQALASEGGGSGRGRGGLVLAVAGIAAAVGALLWWRQREGEAEPAWEPSAPTVS
jgi:hypothetical protein